MTNWCYKGGSKICIILPMLNCNDQVNSIICVLMTQSPMIELSKCETAHLTRYL